VESGAPRAADRLTDVASKVEAFPASRQARRQLLDAVREERMADAVGLIERSAALTLAVLRVANRGTELRGTVDSPVAAARAMPPGKLAAIVESVPTYDPADGSQRWYPVPEHIEAHAGAVRRVTEMLAAAIGLDDSATLVSGAVVHDVGKIVLSTAHGADASLLYVNAQRAERLVAEERRHFGIDHAAAGGWLLREWNLPETLIETVEHHHDSDARDGAAVVRLADMLVHYSQGLMTDLDELNTISASIGVSREQLSDLLYELPQPLPPPRRAAKECPLSERELDVLRLLADGKLYKQIAQELDLSASTVRSHLHRTYKRLDAADRTQAVLIATEAGWL
jgi:putative nucleotidyltransferase with HDIG domain